jgi:hypothetical protein
VARRRKQRPTVRGPRRNVTASPNARVAPRARLRVAAFGDSLMWGQGLNRSDTFAELIKRGLGIENGKQAILDNRARSGAVLIGRDDQRKTFLYLYPTFFKGAAPLRRRFLNGDEGRARLLYGEVPASLPSVKYQVGRFIGRVGNRIDVALLTGGANDIGFTDVVNPQKFPGAFIEEYDGQIRRVAHDDLLDQIQHTRQACPRALIMVFGYYPPLSYASDDSAIKAYFEREFNDGFLWWVNEEFGIEDIDRMILEAKVRAVWALGRAQHWMRKAITKANRSDDRGPGILFVPSGMTQDNAAFAPATEMHEDYRPPTKDDARTKRENTIPRIQLLDRLRRMLRLLTANEFRGKELRALRDALDGPSSLIRDLTSYIEDPSSGAKRNRVREKVKEEVQRIQRAQIASFLHPNEAGARRYAQTALERYREYRRLATIIQRDERPGAMEAASGGLETLADTLRRYRMRSEGSLLADIGLLDVDALALIVVTRSASDRVLAPNMFLVIDTADEAGKKAQRRYQLNFPYRLGRTPDQRFITRIKKFYPHFEPGETNRFTLDTVNLRLTEIVGIKLVMGPDELAGQTLNLEYGTTWRPRRVNLEINGVEVFDETFERREISPGGELELSYPPPAGDATVAPA